jgi:hypothetical protein
MEWTQDLVLALEPLSTILPGNYRHLQHAQALDRPTPEVSVREAHTPQSRRGETKVLRFSRLHVSHVEH